MASSPYRHIVKTLRGFFTILYLILIVLTIPISFQVGGVYCGLAFTVTLFNMYGLLTILRLMLYKNTLFQLLYSSQTLVIPSLLTIFLSLFNNHDLDHLKADNVIYYKFFIKPWKFFITNSTPLFTILEGFCTILAIQSIGQTFNWLKVKKSESWVIVGLLSSSGVITTSLYFLYKIYLFPIEISSVSSSLIGVVLTFCTGLGIYGIISNRGSPIESSLLFGYIVRCIYETFPELSNLASNEIGQLISTATNQFKQEFSNMPALIFKNIKLSDFLQTVTLNVPNSFQTVLEFLLVTVTTITPSILVNLAYRVSVFYSATRIIPALKSPQPSNKSMKIIYAFSPCIVIAVYTHLMMQYSNNLDQKMCIWNCWSLNGAPIDPESQIIVQPWLFWNWINMFSTLGLYAVELFSEQGEEDRWKID